MGCNCRGKRSRSSSRRVSTSRVTPRKVDMCRKLELLGDNIPLRVSSDGRIYLNPPLGLGSGLAATPQLSSLSCQGTYARALKELDLKVMALHADPARLEKFNSDAPYKSMRFKELRDLLLSY